MNEQTTDNPSPTESTIYVWELHLERCPTAWLQPDALPAEEQQRAAKFAQVADRQRFVAGRHLLRRGIAHHTSLKADEVRLEIGSHGKPALADPQQQLYFNLSHAADMVSLAISEEQEVGIDVESPRDLPWRQLAMRYFHPVEQQALEELTDQQGRERFFQIWTRKEAVIKAIGTGLYTPLTELNVCTEDESAVCEPTSQRLWVCDLEVERPYYSAVAAITPPEQLVRAAATELT